MGSCCSCLGIGRRDSDEDGETSRLLYDDPYRSNYGTRGPIIQRPVYQPDPESVRREREALEGICHTMSDNVIDVFTIQPQGTASVDPSPDTPQATWKADEDPSPDQFKLRTIKKGRGGPIFSTISKNSAKLKAVQDAIG